MAAMALVVAVAAFMLLHETAPRKAASSMTDVLRGFPILLGNPAFLFYTIALSFVTAAFFVFIAGAPYIVVEEMARSPQVYGLYFMMNAGGYMIGNFVTGRFGQRIGSVRLVLVGTVISTFAMLIALYFAVIGPWNPPTLFIPLALSAIGNGLTIPGATAAALSVRPDLAGTAAGISGAAQLGAGAVAAVIAGLVVERYAPSLVILMLVCTLIGLVGAWFARRCEMQSA